MLRGRDDRDGDPGRDGRDGLPGAQGPKDLEENLVQQVDLQDLKASQELGEQLDHKDLLDQLDQGVEG